MAPVIGMVIGGFVAVWVLHALLDWGIISRIFDDPFKGKIQSKIDAGDPTSTFE